MVEHLSNIAACAQIMVFLLLLAAVLIYRELRDIRFCAVQLLRLEAERELQRDRDAASWRRLNP